MEPTETGGLLFLKDVKMKYPDKSVPRRRKFIDRLRTAPQRMVTVLNDIDLFVGHREFITLVGPTGCGKSTLLRLILGSERPTSGTILMEGMPLEKTDRNRGIVFQRYSLFPHMNALQNVAAGIIWERSSLSQRLATTPGYRRLRKEVREIAAHYMERFGMGEHMGKYPSQLSGGQRQRVAIAQAVVMKPKILLMDEPFSALDDTTRQSMQLFMLEMWKETEMTVFFVTHDLEEAVFLGTRVLVLSQYYKTDDPASEGAKIVSDLEVDVPFPRPTDFKYSPYFNVMLRQIRHDGLDPATRQHISRFNHSHPHSITDPQRGEWRAYDEEHGGR